MASLLDTIRANSNALATQQQGVTDQSAQLGTLLRAKSGKDVGGGDISASNLGEQQAVSNTNSTMQNQVAPAAQIQNQGQQQQAAAQEQQTNIQAGNIAQQSKFNTIKSNLQTNQILNEFERSKGQLSLDKDKAAANQLVTNLRLQNQKYVDQLQMEGQRNRLDDSSQFQEQLAQITFGDNLELLQRKLGNQSILSANDRDFKRAMGDMDINYAYQIFDNEMAGEKQRQLYGGIGALATAGIAGAGTYSDQQDKSAFKEYSKSGGKQDFASWKATQD